MIYSKDIDKINWHDIEEFCSQGIPEGAYLDYKKDFPSHLEKTIAAMANTLGGVILIGVEENDENKPKTPIDGIHFKRGFSTKVTNIILSNISPPVFPEITVCKNKTDTKAIVLVRIHQSHQTPHAIQNNTKVYIRTGDRNYPEKLATIDEVSWLSNERQKSIALKKKLIGNAEELWEVYLNWVNIDLGQNDVRVPKAKDGLLTIIACPMYPKKEFVTPPTIKSSINKISVIDFWRTSDRFPPKNQFLDYEPIITSNGISMISYKSGDERVLYTNLNSFGLMFFRQSIKRVDGQFLQRKIKYLVGDEVFVRIDEFLDFIKNFYNDIGYHGYVDLQIKFEGILEIGLLFDYYEKLVGDSPLGISPENEVFYRKQILVTDVAHQKRNILHDALKRLFWVFNIDFSDSHLARLNKYIKNVS